MTERLYILGHPVAHSKSPAMYNALYSKLGLDWHYDFMDLDSVEAALHFLRRQQFLSINITTPYKPEAYEVADVRAASAELAHGVNLLVTKDNKLIGYNVDGQGCIAFLENKGVRFSDARVVVCGTGPTATAIVNSAAEAGAADIVMLGRDKERARRIMDRYLEEYARLVRTAIPLPSPFEGHLGFAEAYEHAHFRFGSYETSKETIRQADVIIDATPLGMHEGDPAPFDTTLISSSQIVMDTVYGHGVSALMTAAEAAGATHFDGAGMLVFQAVISAIIVCEIHDISLPFSTDEIACLMAKAAGFE